jgi:hypothetical protein
MADNINNMTYAEQDAVIRSACTLQQLTDTTWGNDACPSMGASISTDSETQLRVWLGYPDENMRDGYNTRYSATVTDPAGIITVLWETDNLQDALNEIDNLYVTLALQRNNK